MTTTTPLTVKKEEIKLLIRLFDMQKQVHIKLTNYFIIQVHLFLKQIKLNNRRLAEILISFLRCSGNSVLNKILYKIADSCC